MPIKLFIMQISSKISKIVQPVDLANDDEELQMLAANDQAEMEEQVSWSMLQIVAHLVAASHKDALQPSVQEGKRRRLQAMKMEQPAHPRNAQSNKKNKSTFKKG